MAVVASVVNEVSDNEFGTAASDPPATLDASAMSGKRHHYLPQFLLRRFAEKEGDHAGLVWRADLSRERVLRVAPKHEAAKRHYYRLPPESGLPPDFAERTIGVV